MRAYVCVSTKKHKATEEVLDLLECAFVIPWLLNAVSSLLVNVKTKKKKKTHFLHFLFQDRVMLVRALVTLRAACVFHFTSHKNSYEKKRKLFLFCFLGLFSLLVLK